uniref:Uncharacterized protein n=1 Tax=Rhizophora mucronata TaxID=61149 RepID=A0A2P2NPJ0_RHIMU
MFSSHNSKQISENKCQNTATHTRLLLSP